MKVGVLGLWHLGAVTAGCTAAAGHSVCAWDPDPDVVRDMRAGQAPVREPGLEDLLHRQLLAGNLIVVDDLRSAVRDADVVWIAFDTPVDADDHADIDAVVAHVAASLAHVKDGALVLGSSQWPVGTTRRLEQIAVATRPNSRIQFASCPENLRLGSAIETFTAPDRVVLGVRDEEARSRLTALFAPITDRLEWMGVESAEMTKHAINAFMATSVAFINEVAALCELVGAEAKEVERGLKTDSRIGPRARLSPGSAFGGGTLARDVQFLRTIGREAGMPTTLFDSIESSNRVHRQWPERRLQHELGSLRGRRIAIWGLTYKPGTSTLRQSTSLALSQRLVAQGADVHVHDPAAEEIPPLIAADVTRHVDPLDAAAAADGLVVATEWPLYRQVSVDVLASRMPSGLVIDANGFLTALIGSDPRFRLIAVGHASR